MQRDHGAQETAEVDDEQLVVRARGEAARQRGVAEVREEVERVLEVVHDLVVHGHRARGDVGEVLLDVGDARLQAAEGGELLGDARRERRGGGVFDVAQEVLDANFLGFFGLDGGRRVEECRASFCAVLWSINVRGRERM